jgi:PAS domain S-box-containing protein
VDCIISDYQMPGMNGMELLLNLRKEGDDTPVIFLTGQGNEGVAREAFKNGAFDYFTKDIGFAHFARIINSIEQAVSLRSARAEHQKVEEAIRNTAEGVSAKTGEMFFRSLAQYLAKALGVKYAFIGEIDDKDPGHARTVAFWAGEGFAETFEYQLVNTPCDNVVKENMRCYPKDLKGLFPNDIYTAKFDVESYAGTPLWDSSGQVIGLLVVFDTKPMQDEENVKAVLKVFASRASAELERLKSDNALRQKEARLVEERNRARKYFDFVRVMMVVLAEDQTVAKINQKGCEVLGYSEEEIIGQNWFDKFIPERSRDQIRDVFIKVMDGEPGLEYYENVVLTKGGEERTIDWRNSVFYDEYEKRHYILSSGEDITERKLLERQKEDFYAMVTHDLKSPLTAMMGHTRLLAAKAGKLDTESNEMIASISSSGKKLYRMVEDFLSVSQLDGGKLNLRLYPSDLSQALKEVYADLEPAIRGKGLIYKEEISAALPATLVMDHKLVQRAVYNLLQNSINYTPPGGEITLKAESVSGGDGDYAVISVTDSGRGIPADEQGKVFEKYYRSPKTSGIKGTGLGLAIVKAVADTHGGRVELQSEAGKGCTFKLFLPTGLKMQQAS